jgi:hypothetical protein
MPAKRSITALNASLVGFTLKTFMNKLPSSPRAGFGPVFRNFVRRERAGVSWTKRAATSVWLLSLTFCFRAAGTAPQRLERPGTILSPSRRALPVRQSISLAYETRGHCRPRAALRHSLTGAADTGPRSKGFGAMVTPAVGRERLVPRDPRGRGVRR